MRFFDFLKKGEERTVQAELVEAPAVAKSVSGYPQEYIVKTGDSLAKIARNFYGTPHQWVKIYQANTDQIRDPNHIFPGQKLRVPKR